MRKSLLIAIAALFVAVGANAQVKKFTANEDFKGMAAQFNVSKGQVAAFDFGAAVKEHKAVKKNKVRKAAAIADIAGTYILEYANWDRDFTTSTSFTIEAESGTITLDQYDGNPSFDYNVKLTGFTETRATAYGEYDAATGEIFIPVQTLFSYTNTSTGVDYGRIVFSAFVLDSQDEPYSYGYGMTLIINDDGTVDLDEGDFSEEIAAGEAEDGIYIGGFYNFMPDYLSTSGNPYSWNNGLDAEFFIPNGVMGDNEVHIENGAWGSWANTERDVYVEDYGDEIIVHNFLGLRPVSLAVSGDQASFATPLRAMEDDYADEGEEEANYIQIWQWDENFENILNPGSISGTVVEGDGAKMVRFYDTEYREAWTDESGDHEAGNYYVRDYTKWFMVHSTWGAEGAYWWGEARYGYVMWNTDADGINAITTANNTNKSSKIYNLAGQQVGKNYKGIVVENGVKKIQK